MRAQHLFLFVLVTLLAVSFLHSPGTDDIGFWMNWLHNAEAHGLRGGYEANEADYPPLSSAILLVVAKTSRLLHMDLFIAFKLSLTAFLVLTSVVFWAWTRDLFLAAVLQLVLMLNSVALAYIDIYFAPLLVLALWALQARKWLWFTLSFTLACLIKWQPLIIAPFLLIYILDVRSIREWRKIDFRALIRQVVLPLAVLLAGAGLVFGPECLRALQRALINPFLSGTAVNLGWVLTQLLHIFSPRTYGGLVDGHATVIMTDDWRWHALLQTLFAALYLRTCLAFRKQEKSFENLLLYSFTGFVVYFVFNTGVHENHLFIACILATALFWRDRRYLSPFVNWCFVANLNLLLFYGAYGTGLSFSGFGDIDLAFIVSIVVVALGTLFFLEVIQRKERPAAEAGSAKFGKSPKE